MEYVNSHYRCTYFEVKKEQCQSPACNLIKILRIFLSVGHLRDPKGEDHGYLITLAGINAPKSVPFNYENNAQTLPKQL